MRLIALISAPNASHVLEAILQHAGWQLDTAWVEPDSLRPEFSARFPDIQFTSHWDSLLTLPCDGVLVAGASPDLLAASHQLIKLGRPILVLIPNTGDPSRLFSYTSLWQEYPKQVTPLFLSGVERAAANLLNEFESADHGTLWKVEFDRHLPAKGSPKDDVSTDLLLLNDLRWITQIAGVPKHVQMQVSGPENEPAETTILLGGEKQPEVRWRLLNHSGNASWKLRLHGTGGESTAPGEVSFVSSDETTSLRNEISAQLEAWAESVKSGGTAGTSASWKEVIQFAEIGAAARRSLKRWRRIDIHFEDASERSQFKTQMATLGCGALLWTMFGMIALLMFSELIDPRDKEFRKSSAAGFVIRDAEFQLGTNELTESGKHHFSEIVSQWSSTSPVLIVEKPAPTSTVQEAARQEAILSHLTASGIRDPEARTVFRTVPGMWYPVAMTLGWIVVFAPLAVTLLLQLLIFVTRTPFAESRK